MFELCTGSQFGNFLVAAKTVVAWSIALTLLWLPQTFETAQCGLCHVMVKYGNCHNPAYHIPHLVSLIAFAVTVVGHHTVLSYSACTVPTASQYLPFSVGY